MYKLGTFFVNVNVPYQHLKFATPIKAEQKLINMTKDELIELYAELINRGIADSDIFIDYRGDLNAEEFAVYMKEAEALAFQERLKTFPSIYKRKYYISIACLLASLLLFFVIIPMSNIVEFITFISIVGAFCIVISTFFVLVYRNSWLPSSLEKRRKKGFDYVALIVLSLVPVIIITFILSLIIENGAYQTLKNTQEEVMGTVIDGLSRASKSGRGHTYVVVQFTTKTGKEMIVAKDISRYQFKDFYKGQQLVLVYSRDNPKNIDLLIDKSVVKDLMSTDERSINAMDLFHLLAIDTENILPELNKISYGWRYDSVKQVWKNNRANSSISLVGRKLIHITNFNFESNYYFLKSLDTTEFNRMVPSKILGGAGVFESADYSIFQQIVNEKQRYIITTVTKKHETKSKKI